jgi:hypothetical protein
MTGLLIVLRDLLARHDLNLAVKQWRT